VKVSVRMGGSKAEARGWPCSVSIGIVQSVCLQYRRQRDGETTQIEIADKDQCNVQLAVSGCQSVTWAACHSLPSGGPVWCVVARLAISMGGMNMKYTYIGLRRLIHMM
jgi:hypothetical protein